MRCSFRRDEKLANCSDNLQIISFQRHRKCRLRRASTHLLDYVPRMRLIVNYYDEATTIDHTRVAGSSNLRRCTMIARGLRVRSLSYKSLAMYGRMPRKLQVSPTVTHAVPARKKNLKIAFERPSPPSHVLFSRSNPSITPTSRNSWLAFCVSHRDASRMAAWMALPNSEDRDFRYPNRGSPRRQNTRPCRKIGRVSDLF